MPVSSLASQASGHNKTDHIIGKFGERDLPDFSSRNWAERGFTVGIGG